MTKTIRTWRLVELTVDDEEAFAEGARPTDLAGFADLTAEAVETGNWVGSIQTIVRSEELPSNRSWSAGSGGVGSTVLTAVVAELPPFTEL